jgi:methylthioribose-1-phosphate isomerase
LIKAVDWQGDCLRLLDQTKLPRLTEYIDCRDFQAVAEAIRCMQVRGAPAIGTAAAFGMVLAAQNYKPGGLTAPAEMDRFRESLAEAAQVLSGTRPTAVNLFWAIERMLRKLKETSAHTPAELIPALEEEAAAIYQEDILMNQRIGQNGCALIPDGARILTHCNAGALATAGFGTALGIIRAAHASGRNLSVWVDETRPLLQGARLTAWELLQEGIAATLITDSMAGFLMQQGKVDLVLIGADRIAANGDTANKIGSYSLAVLAKAHGLPFYVAAPWSTVDLSLSSGQAIPIEEREPAEVREICGQPVAPAQVPVYNPAFDVTPGRLITAIITDRGIVSFPFDQSLPAIAGAQGGETT